MRRTAAENSSAIGPRLLGGVEIRSQRAGLAEVDVAALVRLVRVVVDQDADDPRHRARDRHLACAQQRDAVEAEPARGDGGELGVEVLGQREDAADHEVGTERVALHQLAHELLRGAEDGVGVVAIDGGGAAQGEEPHDGGGSCQAQRGSIALEIDMGPPITAEMEAYAASTGAAGVTCAALCALVLAERFLARGTARLLLLACALAFSAVAFAGATLLGAPAPESTWLWALAHGGLAAGLAAGCWGGSRALRRRLADPALGRARTLAQALAATILGAVAAVAAIALASAPEVPVAWPAGAVAAASLAALVVVVRRGRRGDVERRLPLLAAAVPAAALLELGGETARYASRAVDVVAMAALTAALVHDLGLERRRLGAVAAAEDPLTGAHTRTAALLAAAELHRSRSPREPLAIALVGLDALGTVNKAYGQLAGDAVLQAVAGLLRGALREEDIVGRFGGDAFVAILPGTGEPGAALALDRALEAVREAQLGTWARPLQLTASAGIALVGAGERAVDSALVAADHALGDAQRAGGDRLVSATGGPPEPAPVPTRRRASAGPRAA